MDTPSYDELVTALIEATEAIADDADAGQRRRAAELIPMLTDTLTRAGYAFHSPEVRTARANYEAAMIVNRGR